jgi:hypothetical protein
MDRRLKNLLFLAFLGASALIPKKASSEVINFGYGYDGLTNRHNLTMDCLFGNENPYVHVGMGSGRTEFFSDLNLAVKENISLQPIAGYQLDFFEQKDDAKRLSNKEISSVFGLESIINLDNSSILLQGSSSENKNDNFSEEKMSTSEHFLEPGVYDYNVNTDVYTKSDFSTTARSYDGLVSYMMKSSAEFFMTNSNVNVNVKGSIDTTTKTTMSGTVSGVPVYDYVENSYNSPVNEERNLSSNSIGVGCYLNKPILASLNVWSNNTDVNGFLRLVFKTDSYKDLEYDTLPRERKIANYLKSSAYSNIGNSRVKQVEREGYENTVIFSADTYGGVGIKYTGENFRIGGNYKAGAASMTLGYKSFEITGGSDKNQKPVCEADVTFKF